MLHKSTGRQNAVLVVHGESGGNSSGHVSIWNIGKSGGEMYNSTWYKRRVMYFSKLDILREKPRGIKIEEEITSLLKGI